MAELRRGQGPLLLKWEEASSSHLRIRWGAGHLCEIQESAGVPRMPGGASTAKSCRGQEPSLSTANGLSQPMSMTCCRSLFSAEQELFFFIHDMLALAIAIIRYSLAG